ncbi:NlpC/P60 family protein [Kitasatospora brasiliensis]|uniref:C40 family peptidase n=1 Tax=Kitasatospora brasiliensis TaxID=3058040 RepID=UPI00292F03EC|nr:NlpC/P60 family protein [Kitasatospora sp. K002]
MKSALVACGAVLALAATGFGALVMLLVPAEAASEVPSVPLATVPEPYRPWIERAAADCPRTEMTPALLAAQLDEESGFRADARSTAGAEGPAQFMPGTWAVWGHDDDHNGVVSPHDIGDAVMAQGRFMCSLLGQAGASGIADDLRRPALAGYNAGWAAVSEHHGVPPYPETQKYVSDIIGNLPRFEGATLVSRIGGSGDGPDAVRRAAGQIGVPYSYGGGSPAGPGPGHCADGAGFGDGRCQAETTVGWDCSSLVQYAYWPSRRLPRTAAEQYTATAQRPVTRDDLQVGDLLFWRHGDGHVYHVALYAGDGQMISAPKTGDLVRRGAITDMPTTDYLGATRP